MRRWLLRSSVATEHAWLVFDNLDVLCSGAFRSLADFVANLLSFAELFKTDALERRAVKEHVFLAAVANETETLVGDSLDCAFFHLLPVLLKWLCQTCLRKTFTLTVGHCS